MSEPQQEQHHRHPFHHRPTASTTKLPVEDITGQNFATESFQTTPSSPNHEIHNNANVGGGGVESNISVPPPGIKSFTTFLDPGLAIPRLSSSTNRSASPYPPYGLQPHHPPTYLQKIWANNQGIILVTISQLFGALMNVATRLVELEGEGMHPFQVLFARQGLTAVFCTVWMWWRKLPDFPLGHPDIRGMLCLRSFFGFFGIFGMYYSLQYLPIADAVVITFLAPSVAGYGCSIFLHEPFPRTAQYASLLSLIGVAMIARPTSFFPSSSTSTSNVAAEIANTTTTATPTLDSGFPTPTSGERLSAVLVALLGVIGSAGALTTLRKIGPRAHPLLSVNYFSAFSTLISLLALLLAQPLHLSTTLHFALPSSSRQWCILLFLGSCGFIMQYLLTRGLSQKEGARVMNMLYTNMLWSLGLDWGVFGTVPGGWSVAGSGLILGCAVWVGLGKGEVTGEGERGDAEVGVSGEEMVMLSAGRIREREAMEVEEMRLLGGGGSPDEEVEEDFRDRV